MANINIIFTGEGPFHIEDRLEGHSHLEAPYRYVFSYICTIISSYIHIHPHVSKLICFYPNTLILIVLHLFTYILHLYTYKYTHFL